VCVCVRDNVWRNVCVEVCVCVCVCVWEVFEWALQVLADLSAQLQFLSVEKKKSPEPEIKTTTEKLPFSPQSLCLLQPVSRMELAREINLSQRAWRRGGRLRLLPRSGPSPSAIYGLNMGSSWNDWLIYNQRSRPLVVRRENAALTCEAETSIQPEESPCKERKERNA